jgi:hypothetical protein
MSRAARSALQILLAVLGIAAFLLLLDVLFNYTAPVAKGVTDRMSRDDWIYTLLGVLAALFLLELLFLGRGRDKGVPAPDAGSTAASGAVYLLGCPACGTVFEHRDDGRGRFKCTNCLREGRFQGGQVVQAPIRHHDCTRCGNRFEAYHDTAECPVCHLEQPVT